MAEGIPPDPQIDNGFARGNPGYRYRAAKSYEQSYFEPALNQLLRALALAESERAPLRDLLRNFTYRWLDRYVLREGKMPAEDLAELVGFWQAQLTQRYGSEAAQASRAWQKSPDNPLYFLFRVHRDSSGPARD